MPGQLHIQAGRVMGKDCGMNGTEALVKVLDLLSGGVTFIGGCVCVFGLVQLGLAIKDGSTGGGGQLAGAIAMIAGGAIVAAAGVWFGSLDTSWMG